MATLAITINQTDNGKVINIKDVTVWPDAANTGVTAVSIVIGYNGTNYTVVNESKAQPCAQSALEWNINASVLSQTVYADGMYEFTYTPTTSPATTPITARKYLLDYNSKKYVYELYENAPYQLALNNFAYNNNIKKIQLANTLLKGMQYAAATGQTTKAQDVLTYFDKFKRVWP